MAKFVKKLNEHNDDMEIVGRIIVALPEMSGTSKAGNPWKKREYVLETQENYPKKVHFDFFGERADQYPLNVGDFIKLSFDIESREYNGRWFTSIRGWNSEPATADAPGAMPAPGQAFPDPVPPVGYGAPAAGGYQAAPAMPAPSQTDDLPF